MEWVLTGDEPIYVDELNPPPIIPLIGEQASQRQLMFWINKLVKIFEDGDKIKVEAIKAQLRLLSPGEKAEKKEQNSNTQTDEGIKLLHSRSKCNA